MSITLLRGYRSLVTSSSSPSPSMSMSMGMATPITRTLTTSAPALARNLRRPTHLISAALTLAPGSSVIPDRRAFSSSPPSFVVSPLIPPSPSKTTSRGRGRNPADTFAGRPDMPPDLEQSQSVGVGKVENTEPQPTAASTDAYLDSKILHPSYGGDPSLDRGIDRAAENGLPDIAVSPQQGQFLAVLVKSIKAERVLEIGTLGGYSTSFLSKALPPHGQLDTLELSPHHARIAQENFLDSDLYPFPNIIVGPALESLEKLDRPIGLGGAGGGYDMVFIDANKDQILDYFLHALRLVRKDGVILVDNAVRNGRITLDHNDKSDINVSGLRKLYDWVEHDEGKTVLMSAIQTVGSKTWDGFAVAVKL